eukprot:tig00000405_g429.t1
MQRSPAGAQGSTAAPRTGRPLARRASRWLACRALRLEPYGSTSAPRAGRPLARLRRSPAGAQGSASAPRAGRPLARLRRSPAGAQGSASAPRAGRPLARLPRSPAGAQGSTAARGRAGPWLARKAPWLKLQAPRYTEVYCDLAWAGRPLARPQRLLLELKSSAAAPRSVATSRGPMPQLGPPPPPDLRTQGGPASGMPAALPGWSSRLHHLPEV